MRKLEKYEGSLDNDDALRSCSQHERIQCVLDAMVGLHVAMHDGLRKVHADIAPANICVRRLASGQRRGVLIDLGQALNSPGEKAWVKMSRARFASVRQHGNTHICAVAHVADDFESMMYTLVHCLNGGTLPWDSLCPDDVAWWNLSEEQHHALALQKLKLSSQVRQAVVAGSLPESARASLAGAIDFVQGVNREDFTCTSAVINDRLAAFLQDIQEK